MHEAPLTQLAPKEHVVSSATNPQPSFPPGVTGLIETTEDPSPTANRLTRDSRVFRVRLNSSAPRCGCVAGVTRLGGLSALWLPGRVNLG